MSLTRFANYLDEHGLYGLICTSMKFDINALYMRLPRCILNILFSLCCLLASSQGVWAHTDASVELSEPERAWIADHLEIRVANELDWPPFDFVDDQQQAMGFSIDYFHLIADKVGLNVRWINGYSWQELLELGQARQIDVFPAIILNEEREQFLSFSGPYVENVVGYFMRSDAASVTIEQVEQLGQYRLALVRGFENHRQILQLLPEIERVEVDSVLEGLKAVMTGEADLLIADTAVGNYLIKKHLLRGVQVAGGVKLPELFETAKIRIAARNDQPELISILMKGMAAVSEQEMQALRTQWLELPQQPLRTKERLIILVVAAVVLVLTLAAGWIWALRRQRGRLMHEMRQQTRVLNESERRLALALQGGGMAAWDVDLRSGVMVLSEGWWQMSGMEQAATFPTREAWMSCIHPQDRSEVLKAEAACRQGQTSRCEIEYRVRGDDGKRRWHQAIAAAVDHAADGMPKRMVGVIQDITERKRLERLKDEFVSSVSHELRTPLTSIKGALGLLVGGGVDKNTDEAAGMLQIAHENSERLLILINDLLDMDKMQAGKLDLHLEKLHLVDLINKALQANQGYADKYGVLLGSDMQTMPSLEFSGDEHRLLQILSNLISNAIKFSPRGEVVSLAAAVDDNVIRLSVTDRGPGIPQAFKSEIFKPFSQADGSDTRQRGGTGLGLAITKRLVELHGGSIGFDSQPGQGAVFYIRLPLQ